MALSGMMAATAFRIAMHPCTISVIVPALNEERVVGSVIDQIMERVIAARFADYEVILVNDGSTDRTGEIMESAARRYPKVRVLHNEKNLRFGNSFKRGLAEARFDYVSLLCGDGGLPAASLPAIFDCIGQADIVVPWMTNMAEIKSPVRYFLSSAYTKVLNLTFGLRLNYYNGLPVHRRDLLQKVDITSGGFGFQAEILIKLIKSGATYVQVGVKGAEEKGGSYAMKPRNWISVARTFVHLLFEIFRFKRIPPEVVARRPAPRPEAMSAGSDNEVPHTAR
jgi:glycosyltransferase involved in cell wall biosynthesis